MKIRTFKSKSKPSRKSLGILAAPELFVLPMVEQVQQNIYKIEVKQKESRIEDVEVQEKEKKEKQQVLDVYVKGAKNAFGYLAPSYYSSDMYSAQRADEEKDEKERESTWENRSKKIKSNEINYNGIEIVDIDVASALSIERKKSIGGDSFMNSEYILEDAGTIKEVDWCSFSFLPITRWEKLGESTFCEIYIDKKTQRVYKVVPITMKKNYVKVQHTMVDHFIKECLVMERMNCSEYSTKIYAWYMVNSRYPRELIEISRDWARRNKNQAENIIPQANNSSGLFGVIEMEYGGRELEKLDWSLMTHRDVNMIEDELRKCFYVMNELQVEHRDLHQSNVLVKKNSNGEYSVKTIDYSLARAVIRKEDGDSGSITILQTNSKGIIYKAGPILYTNIDKDLSWLFEGDASTDPHRSIYKKMNRTYTGSNRWRNPGPSNTFWMNYLRTWMENQIGNSTQT
ncbi:serine/threonine-protein kinase haspin [Nematocida parisii]|nr:serine/threonine-protein kinase haspin [Nematocida parisii]